jgi:hypothetical protein
VDSGLTPAPLPQAQQNESFTVSGTDPGDSVIDRTGEVLEVARAEINGQSQKRGSSAESVVRR